MTRLGTLTRTALREMWISYRLIAVIGLPMIGGMAVIALPPDVAGVTAIGGAGFWYAIVAGAATCLACALAAWTMARERRRGIVAATMAPGGARSAVPLSWFVAISVLVTVGIAIGSVGPWLAAVARADTPPDGLQFAAAIGAACGAAVAGVALGLLVGTLVRTVPTVLVALALAGALVTGSIVTPLGGAWLPTEGIGLLAHLDDAARPIGDALQSTGLSLVVAAALLLLAVAALERSNP